MKKKLATIVCSTLAMGMALPALADHQIGGYARWQGIMENLSLGQREDTAATFVDQRLRARWQNNINEYVSAVWYGEVDTVWGEQSKGSIGGGGKVGADGVNVETKNAFINIKFPNTPVNLRLGVQGFGDLGLESAFFNDDAAAAIASVKLDKFLVSLGWSKFNEGANRINFDDTDVYFAQASFMPSDMAKAGLEAYYVKTGAEGASTGADLYCLGLSGAVNLNVAKISGFIAYEGGEVGSTDVSAYLMSVAGAAKVGPANLGARVIFYGKDDDASDQKSFQQLSGSYEFYNEGLQIFLTDVYYNNGGGGRHAITDAAYAGYGLLGFVVNGSFTPAANKDLYVKGALGIFTALDDTANDSATSKEGKFLGTELSAMVGYKVASVADVSLRGAYALLGNFYDAPSGGTDPDDMYKLALMVNIPY